jgi:GST-like protein
MGTEAMSGKAQASGEYVIHGAAGTGSTPVEATLTLVGQPYRVIEKGSWQETASGEEMARVNPMRQIPALVLPTGEVMTESAAILIWLADRHPEARLAPGLEDPRRGQFLRWMAFIPGQIYSMYWVRDVPSRLAEGPAAEEVIKARTLERIADCWRIMGEQVKPAGRFLLGDELSVLDVYLTVVSRWSPRRKRFYEAAPALAPVVKAVDAEPRLEEFWARRMPFEAGWEG